MNVSGARNIFLNVHAARERERDFLTLSLPSIMVVSDGAATSPSMNWKIL